jgi:hypothetical protein
LLTEFVFNCGEVSSYSGDLVSILQFYQSSMIVSWR